MAQVIVMLNDEEDSIVEAYKKKYNVNSKHQAIKDIIMKQKKLLKEGKDNE